MPEATEKQLESEVQHAFREYETMGPAIEEIMDIVRKAWIFGRDAGYREAALTYNN